MTRGPCPVSREETLGSGLLLGTVVLKSFTDLEVWKRAHGVVLEIYKLTNPFPRSEQFGVVSQIRRAAYSIPANIAEGFGRRSTKELLQFLAISNGSLEELRYFLILSRDLRYLSPLDFEKLEKDLKAVAQMLGRCASPSNVALAPLRIFLHGTRIAEHGTRNRAINSQFSRSQKNAADIRLGSN